MNLEQQALAARLVAHPRWRWVAGMFATLPSGIRSMLITDVEEDGTAWVPFFDVGQKLPDGAIPDLAAYATQAVLLRMAMEHGQDMAHRWADQEKRPSLGTVAATALLEAWGE